MDGKKIYPIKFNPVLEKTAWGGSSLKDFRIIESNEDYGISWEVSAHPNATNIICNGYYKGKTLEEVLTDNPKEILGEKVTNREVLRVSYINAKDNLSVQVHPSVKTLEQNEIWYILEAPKDAQVILGVNVENTEDLKKHIDGNKTEDILRYIPIEVGDFVYIPGGLVHALTSGVTVLEVGQNHDNTYRLFDYNRGREIHVEKSLKYTRFDVSPTINKTPSYEYGKTEVYTAYEGLDFTIEMIKGNIDYEAKSNHNYYTVYTNLKEKCILKYENESITFERGESILIPAKLGEYSIIGNLELLKSYIKKEGK